MESEFDKLYESIMNEGLYNYNMDLVKMALETTVKDFDFTHSGLRDVRDDKIIKKANSKIYMAQLKAREYDMRIKVYYDERDKMTIYAEAWWTATRGREEQVYKNVQQVSDSRFIKLFYDELVNMRKAMKEYYLFNT